MRGAQGGYKLTFLQKEYTVVGMILRVTRRQSGSSCPVWRYATTSMRALSQCCATLSVWEKLDKAINDVVDHITSGRSSRGTESHAGL